MLVEQNVVCPVLIGRDAPLSAGWHALQRAHETHGGTLLVSGEAGIGKSRYTGAVAERARSLGFTTLQGACFETDRARPYAPLLDLVRTLASSASPSLAAHYFEGAGAELVALFPELRALFQTRRCARRSTPKKSGGGARQAGIHVAHPARGLGCRAGTHGRGLRDEAAEPVTRVRHRTRSLYSTTVLEINFPVFTPETRPRFPRILSSTNAGGECGPAPGTVQSWR